MYPVDVLQFGQNGGPIAGTARRADRSLIVGVLLSVTLHVLVLLAMLALATGQGGRPHAVAGAPPAVTLVLTSPSAAPAPQRHAEQAPVITPSVPSTKALVIGEAELKTVADSSPPKPSDGSAKANGTSTGDSPSALTADPALAEDYRRRLQAHIASYRRTPDRAGGGLVQVQLAIGRDGDVLAVAVAASSGVAELDEEAVATIWRARPMPVIPQALPSRLVVTLPVSFDAKRIVASVWP